VIEVGVERGGRYGASRRPWRDLAQVVFSPDGTRILASSTDKATRLWPTDYYGTICALCAELTRDPTPDERSQNGITVQSPTCLSQ
jgi:hypothetical protein